MGLTDELDKLSSRLGKVIDEIGEEGEIDKIELEDLSEIEEYGDGFREAVRRMEEVVNEKNKELEQASEDLTRIKNHVDDSLRNAKKYPDGSPGGMFQQGSDFREEIEARMEDARESLESARKADGEIEGLKEQAKRSLMKQLEDVEEIGEAEEKSAKISEKAENQIETLERNESEIFDKLDEIYSIQE